MGRKAVRKKSPDGFVRVTIPEELAMKIDELIESSEGMYTSRAEVIREALRLFFQVHESQMGFFKRIKEEYGEIPPDDVLKDFIDGDIDAIRRWKEQKDRKR